MVTATQNSEHLVRQAIAAWGSAVESGVRIQEESAKWLRETLCNSNSLSEWYQKAQAAAAETIAKTQENLDEGMRAINQQAETSVRLVQKALDSPANGASADAHAQIVEWWQAAVESMRATSQALMLANSRMLITWSELARKINDDASSALSHWAEKTAAQVDSMAGAVSANVKNAARQAASD